MIIGIHHTGIVVHGIAAMQTFYCEAFGLQILGQIESVAPPTGNHTGIPGARRTLVFLGFPGEKHLIELVHYIDPPAADGHLGKHQFGTTHLCFSVDDLQADYDRLTKLGVRFETEPKFSDTPAGKLGVIYARDPEGNWLELIEGEVTF
jgi:glyoxylase I family protein